MSEETDIEENSAKRVKEFETLRRLPVGVNMNKLLILFLFMLLIASPAAAVLRTKIDKPKPAEPDAHASTTTVANLSSRVDAVSNKVDAVGNEVDRLSDNKTALEATDARVDALENASQAPVNIYVTDHKVLPMPAGAIAMLNRKLAPEIGYHLARIDAGVYNDEDIATVVAGYNTYEDRTKLIRFCKRILSGRYKFKAPGMRYFLIEQCE